MTPTPTAMIGIRDMDELMKDSILSSDRRKQKGLLVPPVLVIESG